VFSIARKPWQPSCMRLLAILRLPVLFSALLSATQATGVTLVWEDPWSTAVSFSISGREDQVSFCLATGYDEVMTERAFSNQLAMCVNPDTGAAPPLPALRLATQGGTKTHGRGSARCGFPPPYNRRLPTP